MFLSNTVALRSIITSCYSTAGLLQHSFYIPNVSRFQVRDSAAICSSTNHTPLQITPTPPAKKQAWISLTKAIFCSK